MAVNLETKRKPHPMDVYFMKIMQDQEDRKKQALPPPASLSFTGFMVANFDGFLDIPAVNPTLKYRSRESNSAKRKSDANLDLASRSRTFPTPADRTTRNAKQDATEIEHSRPRTAMQRVDLKLKQLKESENLMEQLHMRIATIKSSKVVFQCEKVHANLNVAASLQRCELSAVQQNEKRKHRLAAIVEAARKSELQQDQIQKEMEAKQEFRSKAKERYLDKQAEMNHKSRQTTLLTICALIARSWWWLDLGNKQILLSKKWMKIVKASLILGKCAKIFLWKRFLKKKAAARTVLIMWLPDKIKRWKLNRYTKAVHTLIISIKEWLMCNRYKILAKMYLSRMFRIQKAMRSSRLRQLARAECNWMLLQNQLKSVTIEDESDTQLDVIDKEHEGHNSGAKRLHWLVKVGNFGGICGAIGPGNCLAAIMSFLSIYHKGYIRSIEEWKDVCVKKRKLGFKWMPPRPKYKFLMTSKQLQQAVMQRAHDLLHEDSMPSAMQTQKKKQRERGSNVGPCTSK